MTTEADAVLITLITVITFLLVLIALVTVIVVIIIRLRRALDGEDDYYSEIGPPSLPMRLRRRANEAGNGDYYREVCPPLLSNNSFYKPCEERIQLHTIANTINVNGDHDRQKSAASHVASIQATSIHQGTRHVQGQMNGQL